MKQALFRDDLAHGLIMGFMGNGFQYLEVECESDFTPFVSR